MAHPETIMFIRHAEKPNHHTQGVDENGNNDPDSLTARGWQRAGALAVLFRSDVRLPVPTAIFAPAPSASDPSQRPLQTITPLARKLGFDVQSSHAKDDFAGMLADAMSTLGVVLVSWEHKVLAASLASGLGPGISIDGSVPSGWPDDRFDMVWVFEHVAHDSYRFTQVPQLVLAGDSSQPIA